MALEIRDRVKETCTGTNGDMALAGAVSGFVGFDLDATLDGDTIYYALEDADGTKWEVGLGTLSADSTTLARTTILATQVSFTDTTRQTFSGGTHTIFATYPASKAVYLDASGNLSYTVDISSDTNLAAGTGITLTGDTLSTTDGEIVHDNLSGFVANEHIDWTTDQGATNIHSNNYVVGISVLSDLNDVVSPSDGSASNTILIATNGSTPSHGTLSSAAGNIGLGTDCLASLTSGDYNVAIGYKTLESLTSDGYNVAIGSHVMTDATSDSNVGIGYRAMFETTTADDCAIVGHEAGYYHTTGGGNTAIGHKALYGNSTNKVTGTGNVAVGKSALYQISSGSYNVGVGNSACGVLGATGFTGSNNVGIGHSAGSSYLAGEYNISIGYYAGFSSIDNGDYNIAIGYRALADKTSPSDMQENIAIGYEAGQLSDANRCIYIGTQEVGKSNTTDDILFIGNDAPLSDGTLIKADLENKHLAIGMADDLFSNSAGDPTLQIYPKDAADEAIFVKMPTSHSSNLIQIQNSSGTDLFVVDSTGEITTGSISGGGGARSVSGTTDNGIVTFVNSGSTFAAEANFTYASDELTLTSSTSSKPILHITNTNADATSGELRFNKDSASGADSDVMGVISFYGTDDSDNTHEKLAYIDSYIVEADHSSEAAGLRFFVAENDATLTQGLAITGQATDDGEVDVTIGAGAASTTTIAGTLTMGSTAALTNAGLVAVANQSGITGLGTISSGVWEGTAIANTYVANLPTSKVTSGTFADARIASSNVTQHQGDITSLGTLVGLTLDGDKNITPGDGSMIHLDTSTLTDNSTSGSATTAKFASVAFEGPTLAATNSSVTTTDAATVYISAAPTAGTNQTLTNAWALWVDAGNVRLDGSLKLDSVLLSAVQTSAESFVNNDTSIMTSAAIEDKILSYSYSTTTGTVTSVAITGTDGIQVDSGSPITGSGTITLGLSSIANDKLANSSVSFGGVSLALGASDATPAFDLADATNYPTSSLSGTITNAQLAGSIANAKLANSAVTIGSTSIALGATSTTLAGITALTMASSGDGEPVLTLKTTHTTTASSGELQFLKDAADTEDGEVLGQITFYGEDEGNNNTAFAKIVGSISESDETDEAGKLEFYVAESNGTSTALTAGLVLEGEHATDGEIDVTIGAGAASTTTVAGTLTMGSTAALTNAGLVAVANQSGITGLGTIATGAWEATDVAVAHGGTGASSAADARTNLGLVIGTNVQAYDAQLATLAGLTADQVAGLEDLATLEAPASDGQFIVATGAGAFAYESGATVRTSLGLGSIATLSSIDISANTNLAGGTGITLTGDTLSTTDSEIVHDNLSGFVANEHIDHSGVSVTAGDGLSGGGTIASTRTINVDINGASDLTSPAVGDELLISDADDSNAIKKADVASIVNLADHDALTNFVANEHIDHSSVSVSAGTGLTGGGTIASNRTLSVDINGTADLASPAVADELLISDANDSNTVKKADLASIVNLADHDALTNFVANEHVDHSSVSVSAGTGLSGGGTIASTRTLAVDINGTADLASPAVADELLISDADDSNTVKKADLASIVNLADHDQLTNFVANEHIDWTASSAGTIHSSNYTDTTYTKASFDIDHLFTLVGASDDTDEHLGTFTGSTIADNQTIKAAIQAVETAVETKGVTAGSSSIVTVGALDSGSITSGFGTIATGDTISGSTITASTALKTLLIEYTDGDDAITIHDGGSISVAQAVYHPIANAEAEPEDATVNIDLRKANYFDVELNANVTDIDFTYGKIGQRFMIRFEQDASSGPYTIAWDQVTMDFDGGGSAVAVTISWPGGTAPTMTATDDKADTYGFIVRAEGHMDGFVIGQNMPVNDN